MAYSLGFFLDQLDQPESLRGFQAVTVQRDVNILKFSTMGAFAYRIGSMYSGQIVIIPKPELRGRVSLPSSTPAANGNVELSVQSHG